MEKKEDRLIVAAAPFVFVSSCLSLALMYATKTLMIKEFGTVAEALISASWTSWVAMLCTLTIMFFFGMPSLRKVAVASGIAVAGAIFVLSTPMFDISWLVMVLVMFAVVVPLGNFLYRKLGVKNG